MRTEKEKMLQEGLYRAGDKELRRDAANSRQLTRLFNNTTEEQKDYRKELLKKMFKATGDDIYIEPPFRCDYGTNTTIGNNFYANFDCVFLDVAPITIGDNCMFGPKVSLLTPGHPIDAAVRNSGLEFGKAIMIGDNVWFGGNVVVNPGVTIGNNTIIGSGSVVTKNIPDNVIAAGNPCKIIRDITEEDKEYWEEEQRKYWDEVNEKNKEEVMVKLVAVDMDGTFLSDKKEYNRDRFNALYRKMKERDIKFVVASGNQYYQLKSFFPEIASEISFVAENGALIISEDEELFCGEMSQELVSKILEFLADHSDIRVIMCGRTSAYASEDEDTFFVEGSRSYYHRLQVVPELNSVIDDVIFKFALGVPKGKTDFYLDYFNKEFSGEIKAVTSGHGEIDLIIPGLHKANGLQVLQDKWKISRSEIAAFGDGGNDLEMLSHAEYGYAMKNASQAAKEAASFEAPSNADEGVLVILEELLK